MNPGKVHKRARLDQVAGSEMSPVVPVQLHNFVQTQSQEDCSDSNKSEVLIPLVTTSINRHSTEVKPDNTLHEQDADIPEESQSLLPQIPGITCTFTPPSNDECLSTSSCCQTVQDFPMLSQNNLQEDRKEITRPTKRCSTNGKSQKIYMSPGPQSFQSGFRDMRRNGDKMSKVSVRQKRNKSYLSKQVGKEPDKEWPRESIGKSLNNPDLDSMWSQTRASSTDNLTFSQIPLSQSMIGETTAGLVHSQREITTTQAEKISSKIEGLVTSLDKVPRKQSMIGETTAGLVHSQREITTTQAEKISSKIEGLVTSLDKVPRKQMLVTEATLLHCISQLQDSLHTKLKREHYIQPNIDSYRQLLFTCQTGLSKVSEIHKTEKMTVTQSGYKDTTGLTQAQKTSVHAQAMKDLGKRQMRVLTLLKRQRCLVDLLKTMKRSGTSINKPSKGKTSTGCTERTINTKVTVKPETSRVAQSNNHSTISKPGASRDSSQTFEQISDKNSQNGEVHVLKAMQQAKKSENNGSTENTPLRVLETVVPAEASGLYIHKADITINGAGNNVQDTECPIGYSQTYYTQDTTSGVDLFDDNDGDDGVSTADTMDGNISSDREIFSQVSDNVKVCNAKKGLNGRFDAKECFELSKKSALASRFNQTVLDESVKPHSELRDSDKSEVGVTRNEELDSNYKVDKTEKSEELAATNWKAEEVYKSKIKNATHDEPNEDDEHEITNKLFIKSTGVYGENDVGDLAVESNNVTANQLKRKLDADSGNDVSVREAKRIEMVDAGNDKTKPVSHSDVLWLNMLRVDADKTKSRKSGTQPGNQLQKEDLRQNKVFIASKLPFIEPAVELEKKDFEKSTKDTQTLTARTSMNFNQQRNHIAFDNGNKYVGLNRNSAEPPVCTNIRDIQDESDKYVDIDCVEDYHSPKVCSPLSLAVRGSPCETLNNLSPNCSTVCSEIFTLKAKQFDVQRKRYPDTTSGAQTFGIKHKQNRNAPFSKSDNQTVRPWMVSTGLDQFSKQNIEVKKYSNKATGNENVKLNMTKDKPVNTTMHVVVTDSIGDAIDSVIQRSREMEVARDIGRDKNSCNQKQSILLSLKELVHLGILSPGKFVLSCNVKEVVHKASLTLYGKIRTTDGHTFNTVSSWLSSLYEGTVFKKRKAYDTAYYKGRSLLSYCKETNISSNTRVTQPGNQMTDCSTQVDTAVFNVKHSAMTEDEKWLNKRLSTSVVRLLSDKDLVSNHDLPDNFWTEDFSTVRLNADIWNCVVAW